MLQFIYNFGEVSGRVEECKRITKREVVIDGKSAQLSYYLLTEQMQIEGEAVVVYGIAALLSGSIQCEYAEVSNISDSQTEILDFIGLLSSETAMPITLQQIAEDFIS